MTPRIPALQTAKTPQETLRIALMVHQFPVVSQTFVANLGADLLRAGHDVRILCTGRARAAGPVHDFVAASGLIERASHADRQPPLSRRTLSRIAGMSWRHRAAALGLWAVDRIAPSRLGTARMCAAEGPFDIVHAQFGWVGPSAARQRRWGTLQTRGLVVHFRGHDVSTYVAERGDRVYAHLFGAADLFIANSAYFRDRAVALGCPCDKIRVIGSPIDTDYFAPPAHRPLWQDRPLRLVAVGRLVEKKGFADAIAALRVLRDGGVAATLNIVGNGPERDTLERTVRDLDLHDGVQFAGPGSREDVRAALHAADIMLAPSVRSAAGDEDAAVNTLKEAMATGMPVVGTQHGGIPELVIPGENGLLVPERAPQALATAIADLARMPERWPVLGAAGRKKVIEDYGSKVILQKTLDAYATVLTDRSKST